MARVLIKELHKASSPESHKAVPSDGAPAKPTHFSSALALQSESTTNAISAAFIHKQHLPFN